MMILNLGLLTNFGNYEHLAISTTSPLSNLGIVGHFCVRLEVLTILDHLTNVIHFELLVILTNSGHFQNWMTWTISGSFLGI